MNAFSREVCGSAVVREAFAGYGPVVRFWWRCVLWLHGKPEPGAALSEAQRNAVVADGFAYYARLYRLLGVMLLMVGGALTSAHLATGVPGTLYWPLAAAGGALLLLGAAQVGQRAAAGYRERPAEATVYLAVFLVLLMTLLTGLLAAMSVALRGSAPAAVNVFTLAALFAFGVGSYAIELLYVIGTLSFSRSSCFNNNKSDIG